jgi:hypothetical protein
MFRLVIVVFTVLTASCRGGSDSIPTSPSTVVAPPRPSVPVPTPVFVREVAIGERVAGRYQGGELLFTLTAPRTGMLTVSLSWDPWYLGTLLKLRVSNREFLPARPEYTPITALVEVTQGRRYDIVVGLAGADWIPDDPFVITTALQ